MGLTCCCVQQDTEGPTRLVKDGEFANPSAHYEALDACVEPEPPADTPAEDDAAAQAAAARAHAAAATVQAALAAAK